MAQCSKCGSPLSDDQKFCGTCGTPVTPEVAAATDAAAAETAAAAEAAVEETTEAAAAAATAAAAADVTLPTAATPPPMPATPQYVPPAYPQQGYAGAQAPQGYPPQGYAGGPAPQGYPPQAPQGYQQGYPQGYGQTPYGAGAWQPPRKSRKGLWIGIAAAVVVIAVACVLLFVVFKDQVLGEGGKSDASAQEMLAAAWTASATPSDASGTYDATITLETNTGSMSAEEQMMFSMIFGSPITASGTFAMTASQQDVDFTLGMAVMGQSIDVEVMLADGQPYVNFMGQWYEGPPDMAQQLNSSDIGAGQIQQVLSGLSVDPSTWVKGLKKAGEEDVDGVESIHLTGSPDMMKMITDVAAVAQSSEAQDLMDLGESLGSDAGLSTDVPTAEELAQLQTMLDAMVDDATVDIWLSKEDNTMRKMVLNLRIVPPSEQDIANIEALADLGELSQMLKSITVVIDVTRDGGDQPISIQAPSSALPYTELENAMDSGLGLFPGLLGGSSGF